MTKSKNDIAEESRLKGQGGIGLRSGLPLLKATRTKKQMTQKEVAVRSKISLRQYQRFESGERNMIDAPFRTAMSVCNTLEITPAELVLSEKEKT